MFVRVRNPIIPLIRSPLVGQGGCMATHKVEEVCSVCIFIESFSTATHCSWAISSQMLGKIYSFIFSLKMLNMDKVIVDKGVAPYVATTAIAAPMSRPQNFKTDILDILGYTIMRRRDSGTGVTGQFFVLFLFFNHIFIITILLHCSLIPN